MKKQQTMLTIIIILALLGLAALVGSTVYEEGIKENKKVVEAMKAPTVKQNEVANTEPKEETTTEITEEPKKDEPTSSKTTTVDRYSSEKFSYPCFMLESSVEFPRHILSALARMIESSLEIPNKINIYVDNKGELLSIGGISPVQVKAAIDLLGRSNIVAYYKEDYILTDDLIYVLSA